MRYNRHYNQNCFQFLMASFVVRQTRKSLGSPVAAKLIARWVVIA
jgi:hypothetical protein